MEDFLTNILQERGLAKEVLCYKIEMELYEGRKYLQEVMYKYETDLDNIVFKIKTVEEDLQQMEEDSTLNENVTNLKYMNYAEKYRKHLEVRKHHIFCNLMDSRMAIDDFIAEKMEELYRI